jgi:DNA processing protein
MWGRVHQDTIPVIGGDDIQAVVLTGVVRVSFYQTSLQDWRANRGFFPERNKTMRALSDATVIVEASDISGSLVQARAAIAQGRKLFILNSCFESGMKWPERFLKMGAIRVRREANILEHLELR